MATEGPSRAEIAQAIAGFEAAVADPRSAEHELGSAAFAELLSGPYRTPAERLAAMASVTPDDIATRFAGAVRTALLVVPQGYRLAIVDVDGRPVPEGGCARNREVQAGTVFRPPLLRRATNGAARRARLVTLPATVKRLRRAGWWSTTRASGWRPARAGLRSASPGPRWRVSASW